MSSPSDKRDEDLPDRYLRLPDKVEQQLSESIELFEPPKGMSYEEFHERLWLDEDLWQGILRHNPSPTVFPPDQPVGEGDAKSATYPLHGEMGLPPVNQALGPVEGGFLNGVLLAILGREERAANIMYSRNFEEDLLEGVEGTDKPPVRITDLRLAYTSSRGYSGGHWSQSSGRYRDRSPRRAW